jgi:nicotinamide-nucleotide amidase
MAARIREKAGTTWGLGTTGFAGPTGGTEKDPVGTVYLSVAGPSGTATQRHVFGGDRARVKQFATVYALELLRRTLLKESA